MPHLQAVARRGRVIASLVGVLALVVALFGTVATAGAGTTTTPPTYNHCPPGPDARHVRPLRRRSAAVQARNARGSVRQVRARHAAVRARRAPGPQRQLRPGHPAVRGR